jgi:hypothetical protein
MKHRGLTSISIVSFLISIAVAAVWIRSRTWADSWIGHLSEGSQQDEAVA